MKNKLILVTLFLLVFSTLPAVAAEFIKPDKTGNAAISETGHRNVYIGGGNVTITEDITGDLAAGGGNVLIQASVEDDLMAGGGTVIVNGTVGSDARLGGGNITITGKITGDLLVGGGNVTIAKTAEIGGDLIAGAGNIVVDAPVAGNVRIGGGTVRINNRVSGEVWIMADESLTFGPQSALAGKITHKGKKEAVVEDGAQISQIDFQKKVRAGGKTAPFALAGPLIWALGLVAAGLLFIKFLPKRTNEIMDKCFDQPWTNLGIGLVFAIVLPVTSALLCLTIIGWYAGVVLFAWLGLMFLIIGILETIFLGAIILKWLKKYNEVRWTTVVTGAAALLILSLVPLVGALVCVIVWLMSFGAVLRLIKTGLAAQQHSENQTKLPL